MKRYLIIAALTATTLSLRAGTVWTVSQCMRYAIDHAHSVATQRFALDDSRAERTRAVGNFLPSVEASIGAQYNFGRAIDPETNTYTDVSTFYNSYSLSASLTVFDGLQHYNQLRMARANVLAGRSALQAEQDKVALNVYKAYMDLMYCHGAIGMATAKRDESRALLHQTEVMAEVGQKSDADVAQMQATLAADDYEVTHMQSQTAKALLTLKQLMHYPADDSLSIDCTLTGADTDAACDQVAASEEASCLNPRVIQATQAVTAARHSLRAARGALLPTLSIGAGVSTMFYRNLDGTAYTHFADQMRNNAGEYVYATLSIPIFNRLSTVASIRKSRNALRQAEETLAYERSELRRLAAEAETDVRNSTQETIKMERKVEADSITAHIAVRKYEEGMASPIDVKTATVTLLQSRASLLQSRLTLMYNRKLLQYYKGNSLWTDQ